MRRVALDPLCEFLAAHQPAAQLFDGAGREPIGIGRLALRRAAEDEAVGGLDAGARDRRSFTHAPASVIPSTRIVGASEPRRNTRSFATAMSRNICFRLPAMVISLAGSASAPLRIMKPAAPRL